MAVEFLNLRREYEACAQELNAAALRVLQSGWYILGPEVEAFEREFAAWLGCPHAVGVASGTDALQLALQAEGIGHGDQVVTVPLTAVPTVSAIGAVGARPAFVDIDPQTHCMDPAALRRCLESAGKPASIKAVIVVHLYGRPAPMAEILDIAHAHGLVVIEDVAQATGARMDGQAAGTFAEYGCFSFYPTKNLGACGDGGMVVTTNAEKADRLRCLRNYGESSKFHNICEGVNSRLDEVQAAILRVKLTKLDAWIDRRRTLAERYCKGLAGSSFILPGDPVGGMHAYHLFVVRHARRDAIQRALADEGIGTAVHYPVPVHHQPAYQPLGYAADAFPEADAACREILSLPLSPFVLEEEVDTVIDACRRMD